MVRIVGSSRRGVLLGLGLILAVAASFARGDTHRYFVPVVGHIRGMGEVEWRTDIQLTNRSREEVMVGLTMITEGEPFYVVTMAPGASLFLGELVGSVLGAPGTLGLLEVNTVGEMPVTPSVVIRGHHDGAVVATQGIPVYSASTGPHTEILSGLVSDDEYRTNVGVANAGRYPVAVTLSLRRAGSRTFALTTMVLEPGEHIQQNIREMFPVLRGSSGLEIVAEPSGPGVVVYASVLDNRTHAARFVAARFE